MDAVTTYFEAERAESLVFIAVGCFALLAALVCAIVVREPFFRGIAISLATVAAIQLAVGSAVYVRSPKDIVRVQQILRTEPARIQSEEIPRMRTVMRNFTVYRWVEIGLLLLGLAFFVFAAPAGMLRGAGLGLALQAAFMLVLDFFAERRGGVYLDWLVSLR